MVKEVEINIDELLKESTINTYKNAQKQVRKKKDERLKLTKGITVTLTEDEYAFLEEYCNNNYISKNNLFRQLLREKINKLK